MPQWFGSDDDTQEGADDEDALEIQPMVAEKEPVPTPELSKASSRSLPPPQSALQESADYGMTRTENILPPAPTPRYTSPPTLPSLSPSSSTRQSYVSLSSTGQIVCDGCDRNVCRPSLE